MFKARVMFCIALCAACGCLSAAAFAQAPQTAEGAQAFLSTMAKRGFARATFVDAAGRPNHVVGTHTVNVSRIKLSIKEENSESAVAKSLNELIPTELSSRDAQGAPDACTTRIDAFQPPADLFQSNSTTWEEPGFLVSVTVLKTEQWNYATDFAKFAAPHFIDWRQAQVVRSNDGGRIDVRAKGQRFATNILSFVPGDPELADRIEYATKFLRMSCDETAETGF